MSHRNAAVLVLYEQASDSIILTERSSQLLNHPGEICFPGGLWEEQDESFLATALRELFEEMGIAASRVTSIKELKPEQTLTGYRIYPWLASIKTIEPCLLNAEVVDFFSIAINKVCELTNYQKIVVERQGFKFNSYQFIAEQRFVWGATARIMRQLCELENKSYLTSLR